MRPSSSVPPATPHDSYGPGGLLEGAVRAAAEGTESVSPGLLGFLVVAALGLALYLLVRSMNRHLGRIDVDGDRRRPGRDAASPRAEDRVEDDLPGDGASRPSATGSSERPAGGEPPPAGDG